MAADVPEKVLQSLDDSRRSFLSKLILGSAFVAPSIASFSMSGLAVGQVIVQCTNLFCSNQTHPVTDCSLIRTVHPGNFSGCNYPGQSFRGLNLSGDCLEGTNFSGANLSHSDLSGSNLTDASLAGANLNGANLEQAILLEAHLAGANLNNANLMGARLGDSCEKGKKVKGGGGADLTGANLHGANLTNADLTGANLTGANLQGATLTNVIWDDTTCPDGTNSNDNGGTCVLNLKV
jgi:uncharacterized protein YjbI with pentapeptide repeats